VTTTARDIQVTFDCADPAALAAFWAEVLGYQLQPPPRGFDSWEHALDTWGVPEDQRNSRSALVGPDDTRPRLFFQRVPEGKAAKNRVHLDVRAAPGLEGEDRMTALEAEAEHLVSLGATRVRRFEPGEEMSNGFLVMQDPEGNEFCLD
jgi:catechol 2,3-dioxygenase-like lactoylglutathione lyase family enzyme